MKACVVERFNRTLRERMHKYFTCADNNKYINALDDLLQSYNNSYYRSINCTPIFITKTTDQNKIFLNLIKYNKNEGD